MKNYPTRVSVIKVDDSSYYIGLQFYHSDTWMTLKYISHRYSSYEKAAASYRKLERLGYMNPVLYKYELYR